MLWNGIVESYLEPYKKGDAYGLASSTIVFASLFGITKGINDLGKIKKVNEIDTNAKVNALSDEFGAVVKPFTPKQVSLANGEIAYQSKWGELVRSPNYLDEAGEIKWPIANGFVVDKNGRAITINADLKVGQVVDRYGDAGGRFTSPVESGKILDYDTRGLPYPESSMKYHQYEVLKDITEANIKTAYSKSPKEVQTKIDNVMDKWGLSFEDLANPQQGKVAQVFGAGGGAQIRFITSVKYYEDLGLIKEIK
ncbi:TNT domain-containing protein [Listeria booriae]|nr:TNT domain-containing protein [Listeria booriae]